MLTIYVYSNETGELIDEFTGADNTACETWYMREYDINDYHACYTAAK